MLGDISRVQSIRLVTGYTDMRKSINGLMAIIRDDFKMDPYANALYLFCGRKADRLKALYFDEAIPAEKRKNLKLLDIDSEKEIEMTKDNLCW